MIRNFNFAMLFGVVIGTYSSIFIAAPLLGYLGVKRDSSAPCEGQGDGAGDRAGQHGRCRSRQGGSHGTCRRAAGQEAATPRR